MSSSTWPVHVNPEHLYFITTSAVRHAHVFHRDVIKRILVDSLNTGRILGQYALFAFVIMPNHIHLLLQCLNKYMPSDVMREYKKATANLILRQLECEGNDEALWQLAESAERPELYPWSSARFYAETGCALIPLSDARELWK